MKGGLSAPHNHPRIVSKLGHSPRKTHPPQNRSVRFWGGCFRSRILSACRIVGPILRQEKNCSQLLHNLGPVKRVCCVEVVAGGLRIDPAAIPGDVFSPAVSDDFVVHFVHYNEGILSQISHRRMCQFGGHRTCRGCLAWMHGTRRCQSQRAQCGIALKRWRQRVVPCPQALSPKGAGFNRTGREPCVQRQAPSRGYALDT